MLQRARGLHLIPRGSVVLVTQPSEVAVNTRQRVSCSTVSITDVVQK